MPQTPRLRLRARGSASNSPGLSRKPPDLVFHSLYIAVNPAILSQVPRSGFPIRELPANPRTLSFTLDTSPYIPPSHLQFPGPAMTSRDFASTPGISLKSPDMAFELRNIAATLENVLSDPRTCFPIHWIRDRASRHRLKSPDLPLNPRTPSSSAGIDQPVRGSVPIRRNLTLGGGIESCVERQGAKGPERLPSGSTPSSSPRACNKSEGSALDLRGSAHELSGLPFAPRDLRPDHGISVP